MAQEPVRWVDLIGVAVDGNTLTKTGSTTWGNGGAASAQTISGDGAVSVTVSQVDRYRMFGFSEYNADANLGTIKYAMYLKINGDIEVRESGSSLAIPISYSIGDVMSVERAGDSIEYKKNGSVFHTSTPVSPTSSLLVDVALYNSGSKLNNVMITGADAADPEEFFSGVNVGSAENPASLSVYGNSNFRAGYSRHYGRRFGPCR